MFLGIDVGTTATKAILLDEGLRPVASAATTYAVDRPRPGISEIDPAVWIAAVEAVLGAIRAQTPDALAAAKGIGLSGQMHSLALFDAADRPVRPAILWNDGRGGEEARDLAAALPGIGEATGVVPMPSFTAAKLLWLRRHAPEDLAAARRLAFAKDVVRHRLTGDWATDVSDAAGGQLLDEASRRWHAPVLRHLGLDAAILPRLLEGPEVSGSLSASAAAELGLPPGIPVAAGGGDAATGALGLGCVNEGDAFISLGTGTLLLSVQERYRPEPAAILHTFAHCVPERWYQMAAMLNGASCLAFAARLTGAADVAELLDRAGRLEPGPGRVLFQPYLSGERTPHDDVGARGAFVGLDAAVEAADLAKAVLEGVAFSLRQGRDLMQRAGTAFGPIRLIGGGARSPLWCGLIATILGAPVHLVGGADFAGAGGAARLGAMAAGADRALATAPAPVERVFEPDAATAEAYAERHADWLGLYPALAPFGAKN